MHSYACVVVTRNVRWWHHVIGSPEFLAVAPHVEVGCDGPVGRAQASCVEDWAFNSRSRQTNDLQNCYLLVHSYVPAIVSIRQGMVGQMSE